MKKHKLKPEWKKIITIFDQKKVLRRNSTQ